MPELIEIEAQSMPMLPLRGVTVFPNMLLHFDVERPMSIAAVEAAINAEQKLFLLTQKDILEELPKMEQLYRIGTVCIIKQVLQIPGHGMRVLIEGDCRARLVNLLQDTPYFEAEIRELPDLPVRASNKKEALLRQIHSLFEEYAQLAEVQPEAVMNLLTNEDPGFIADYIAQNIYLKQAERQRILEEVRPLKRLEKMIRLLSREVEILEIKNDLQEKTGNQIAKGQRDYFLREQMKVIQAELGEASLEEDDDLEAYRRQIQALKLADEFQEKLLKEVGRLSKQPFGSSEAAVIRTYLDICLALPWNTHTKDRLDIAAARKVLDADHFGLNKVKERMLEFLAVRQLAPGIKGTILCLVGPPGVGKTSVAYSIARALGRRFQRISLGGIHDEAEIRGHRKTYVGAMPGRIISAVKQAGTKNPLILLDEIDKLGSDYRGDPSAALLEALDPEQNSTFRDNFVEIPFDLSEALFLTTANTTDTIPRPLMDRMEIIELGSYTDEEKLQIAKRHLLPKQRKRHGLMARQLRINDDALRDMIAGYTRESGVRQMERELAAICRKTAAKIAEGEIKAAAVTTTSLRDYLGVRRYKIDPASAQDEIGIVNGLAWTQVGGELLEVEVNVLEGAGRLELTGNLGDVMKESAKAALSYIRSRARILGIDPEFHKTKDIHVHFPEGAIPKDGPSAGITIAIALLSALLEAPVRRDLAMTGEITLRGRILPIGGLKEKTMAALRNNIRTVVIPAENEKDLENIDPTVKNALHFVIADHIDKVLGIALNFAERPQKAVPLPPGVLREQGERGVGSVSMRQ